MTTTLQRLFHYKAWANAALFADLAKCGNDSQIAQLSIKALSHTHMVDRIFTAHLRRQPHSFASANLGQMPALEDLCEHMRDSDAEYIDYVSTISPTELAEVIDFTFTDGATGRMSCEEMLMHIITHGVGHRGQISALMLLNSLKPLPDGFATYLHEVERPERRLPA